MSDIVVEDGPQRPRQAPKGGKGHVLNARITAESREALEAEAARTGRSLSQVAELWIDEARRGHAAVEALLGGPGVADVIRTMAAFSRHVNGTMAGDDLVNMRAQAISAGLKLLADQVAFRQAPDPYQAEMSRLASELDAELRAIIAIAETVIANAESSGEAARAQFAKAILRHLKRTMESEGRLTILGRVQCLSDLREALPQEPALQSEKVERVISDFRAVWDSQIESAERSAQIGRKLASAFVTFPDFGDASSEYVRFAAEMARGALNQA